MYQLYKNDNSKMFICPSIGILVLRRVFIQYDSRIIYNIDIDTVVIEASSFNWEVEWAN